MRVSITTLGCKVNSYESDAMRSILKAAGYTIVDDDEPADICIINTCTVTNIADRKSRQMISRSRRLNPASKLIVMGCWSQRQPEAALSMEGVSVALGVTQKHRIAEICGELYSTDTAKSYVRDVLHEHDFEELSFASHDRTRAYLKIQDGCNRFCSYCAIPFARGGIRSRPIDSVRRELEIINNAGFAEVTLTGIHLTDYGKDIGGVDLADAIDSAEGLSGIKRIRLGSLEPHGMSAKMIERITNNKRVCRQYHLSLQSGSAQVLCNMRRGYTADEYADIVNGIRSAYGEAGNRVAITTDIIAGFPGETAEEHIETLEFMRRIGFARVHTFPYSRRSGTKAAEMPMQHTNAEKARRAAEISSFGKELEREFMRGFIGSTESVLIEGEDKSAMYSGFTDSYVRVKTPHGTPNAFVDVNITEIKEEQDGELYLL